MSISGQGAVRVSALEQADDFFHLKVGASYSSLSFSATSHDQDAFTLCLQNKVSSEGADVKRVYLLYRSKQKNATNKHSFLVCVLMGFIVGVVCSLFRCAKNHT